MMGTQEAADLAGVGRGTILRALADGRIRGTRVSPRGVWLVDRESLLAAVREGMLPAPAGRPTVPDPVRPRPSQRKEREEGNE